MNKSICEPVGYSSAKAWRKFNARNIKFFARVVIRVNSKIGLKAAKLIIEDRGGTVQNIFGKKTLNVIANTWN